MAFKVKGIFKGLKVISRIFAVKEHEMEIGYPTDVKHVAHIGWDSAAGNASPSWMNDVMASPNFSSLGNFAASTGTSWASQDSDQLPRSTPASAAVAENSGHQDSATCPVPRPTRKPRGKKPKDGSPTAPSTSMDELASRPSPPPAAAEADADAAVGVAPANGTQ